MITKIKDNAEDLLFDPRFCTYKLSGKIRSHVEKLTNSVDIEKNTKNKLLEVLEEDEANKNTLRCAKNQLHKLITLTLIFSALDQKTYKRTR